MCWCKCVDKSNYLLKNWCLDDINKALIHYLFRVLLLSKLIVNEVINSVMENVLLTHWGRVTHICINKLTIIGSDNGLSPSRRQAIIWTNAGILLIRTLETNFSDIHAFKFKKMHLKMLSAKWDPICLGLNVLKAFLAKLHWSPPSAT